MKMIDGISLIEAVRILSGHEVNAARDKNRYERHVLRIKTAVRRGLVRVEGSGRAALYSRNDIAQLQGEQAKAGIDDEAQPRISKHLVHRLTDAEGRSFVSAAVAREITSCSRGTPDYWGRHGWYGSVMIDGRWFFEESLLEARVPRAKGRPPREVTCHGCRRKVTKRASRVDEATANGHRLWCSDCWQDRRREQLIANADKHRAKVKAGEATMSTDTRAKLSAARVREWQDGTRDRDAQRAVATRNVEVILRSPPKRVAREEASRLAQGRRALTEAEVTARQGKALSRGQRASDRSLATRELEERLRELWVTSMKVREIADELGTTISNVKKLRQRLGLAPRPRGRRKGDKTLVGHLATL